MDGHTQAAREAVGRFVADNPGFAVDDDTPDQGATNRVLYGQHRGTPVVYKYFAFPPRWRNELYCLQHYADTGVVPAVLASVPDELIVMSRLPGQYLLREAEIVARNPGRVAALSRQVGAALGKLADTPLPAFDRGACPPRDFQIVLWNRDLRAAIGSYLAICRAVRRVIPAYGARFCEQSLDLIESHIESAVSARAMFFHEDVANAMARDGELTGFFDLEMCRIGTVTMQLGVALNLCGPGRLEWSALAAGFMERTGIGLSPDDHLAILAMHHFYHWIRACRWGWWDGAAENDDHAAAVRDAPHHCACMTQATELIRPFAPVCEWFSVE